MLAKNPTFISEEFNSNINKNEKWIIVSKIYKNKKIIKKKKKLYVNKQQRNHLFHLATHCHRIFQKIHFG